MIQKTIKEYGQTEFKRWIENAESKWTEVKSEYEEARKYYENDQTPVNASKTKEYVQENLITDLVNGLVGQLIGGEVSLDINGGDDFNLPIKELVTDIFERNYFVERHLEPIANMFYTEGLGGIYTLYNPFRVSQYGIGMPVIHHLLTSDGELLLDPDSRGFMHEDDTFRIFRQSRLIEYLEKKYPALKGKIKESNRTGAIKGQGTEKYADLYIIEFRTVEFIKVQDSGNEKLLKSYPADTVVEIEKYWNAEMVNGIDQAGKSTETGFSRFKLQPAIHTPRIKSKSWPMGAVQLVKDKQIQINNLGTVTLEAVKADIKNLMVIYGATPAEKLEIQKEAAKTQGIVALGSEGGKLMQAERKPISPALLGWYEWQRKAFDEVSGRYAPERGATDVGLSGRAIGFLQQRGVVPELTKKFHLDYAFTEMAQVLLECAGKKMTKQPFKLTRKNEGKAVPMYFNTPYKKGMKLEEGYNSVGDNGIINDLTQVDIDEIDLSVSVVMDTLGREAGEINKALAAQAAGLISRKDTLKKLYKNEWQELLRGVEEENFVMKIIGVLSRVGPENLQKLADQAQNIEEFVGMIDRVEGVKTDAAQGINSPSQVAQMPQPAGPGA